MAAARPSSRNGIFRTERNLILERDTQMLCGVHTKEYMEDMHRWVRNGAALLWHMLQSEGHVPPRANIDLPSIARLSAEPRRKIDYKLFAEELREFIHNTEVVDLFCEYDLDENTFYVHGSIPGRVDGIDLVAIAKERYEGRVSWPHEKLEAPKDTCTPK